MCALKKEVFLILFILTISLIFSACGDSQSGCLKDTDCRGQRICVNHLCVNPQTATNLNNSNNNNTSNPEFLSNLVPGTCTMPYRSGLFELFVNDIAASDALEHSGEALILSHEEVGMNELIFQFTDYPDLAEYKLQYTLAQDQFLPLERGDEVNIRIIYDNTNYFPELGLVILDSQEEIIAIVNSSPENLVGEITSIRISQEEGSCDPFETSDGEVQIEELSVDTDAGSVNLITDGSATITLSEQEAYSVHAVISYYFISSSSQIPPTWVEYTVIRN